MDRVDCLKCGGTMEEGLVIDQSLGSSAQQQWGSGKPERSAFEGTVPSSRRLCPVATYRCSKCGFLESYAKKN